MKRFRVCIAASLIVGMSVVAAPSADAALPEEAPPCGSSIDHSFRLNADVGPCNLAWITLTRSDLVIDLGGHTVGGNDTNDSSGASAETAVESDFARTTVRNGVVRDFNEGVRLLGNSSRVVDIVALSNTTSTAIGIYLGGAGGKVLRSVSRANQTGINAGPNTLIQESAASFNTAEGANVSSGRVVDSTFHENDGNGLITAGVVSRSAASSNNLAGIVVFGDSARVKNNRSINNGSNGIDIQGDGVVVSGNTAGGNSSFGIAGSGQRGSIQSNDVIANGNGISWNGRSALAFNRVRSSNGIGISVSDSALVANNRVIGNATNGIEASGVGPRIRDNVVNDNGSNGIFDMASGARIRDNTARQNGYATEDGDGLGVAANADATVSGGGNIARLNDDTDQCEPAFLC